MKKIVINKCSSCPHIDHGGGFGQIAYIPVCGLNHRGNLPYTKHVSGNQIVATGTDVIPDWCPLENDNG